MELREATSVLLLGKKRLNRMQNLLSCNDLTAYNFSLILLTISKLHILLLKEI